jgi:hypothetical protein
VVKREVHFVCLLVVITCQILELEFVHLLAKASDLSVISVVEDEFSHELVTRLKEARPGGVRTIAHLNEFRPARSGEPEVLLCVREVGLRSIIKRLQDEIVATASMMGPRVDAILLGYGLCGNALNNPQQILSDAGVAISVPMDEEHPADDCAGLIIGGRDAYYAEQCKCVGSMFMNAAFSRHWKRILRRGHNGRIDPNIVKRLMANYERSLLLPTEVLPESEMASNVEEFNECDGLFEWNGGQGPSGSWR